MRLSDYGPTLVFFAPTAKNSIGAPLFRWYGIMADWSKPIGIERLTEYCEFRLHNRYQFVVGAKDQMLIIKVPQLETFLSYTVTPLDTTDIRMTLLAEAKKMKAR